MKKNLAIEGPERPAKWWWDLLGYDQGVCIRACRDVEAESGNFWA